MSTISPAARQELVTAVAERYQHSTAAEKGWILDEFVALTGYHRKQAIRVLNGRATMPTVPRGRRCVYDEAVTEGLIVRGRHRTVCAGSAATIDRRLAPARAVTAGQRRPRRSRLDGVRGSVPVRTFGDWQDPAPGFVEADLVAHCGRTMAGSFVSTLVLTDIASGWMECVPLLVREAQLVVDAVDQLRGALPFPLRGIDTDNGSEFINEVLVAFCKEHGIELTRSRPYRKNDQAWVEQKNGAVVRRLVGYGRLEGMPAAEALARLHSAARLFVNVFQPSFKLAEKTRDGPSDAATRCRPRRIPEESCARVACRRGTADAPSSQATATTLAHPAGPVRGDLAPRRAVAGGRTASDGEGAVRASATGAPRDVRAGPASDSATPRQGLAPGGSSSSPLQRSERSVPGRCCVGDHRTRTSPPRSGAGRYAIRPRRYRRARPSSTLTGTRNGHYGGPSQNLGGKSSVRSL